MAPHEAKLLSPIEAINLGPRHDLTAFEAFLKAPESSQRLVAQRSRPLQGPFSSSQARLVGLTALHHGLQLSHAVLRSLQVLSLRL